MRDVYVTVKQFTPLKLIPSENFPCVNTVESVCISRIFCKAGGAKPTVERRDVSKPLRVYDLKTNYMHDEMISPFHGY